MIPSSMWVGEDDGRDTVSLSTFNKRSDDFSKHIRGRRIVKVVLREKSSFTQFDV